MLCVNARDLIELWMYVLCICVLFCEVNIMLSMCALCVEYVGV